MARSPEGRGSVCIKYKRLGCDVRTGCAGTGLGSPGCWFGLLHSWVAWLCTGAGEAPPCWFHCHPLPVPRVHYSTVNKWPVQLRLPPAYGRGWVERWTKAHGSPAPTEPGEGVAERPTGSKWINQSMSWIALAGAVEVARWWWDVVQDGGGCRDVGRGWGTTQNTGWHGRAPQRSGRAENFPTRKTCSGTRRRSEGVKCKGQGGVCSRHGGTIQGTSLPSRGGGCRWPCKGPRPQPGVQSIWRLWGHWSDRVDWCGHRGRGRKPVWVSCHVQQEAPGGEWTREWNLKRDGVVSTQLETTEHLGRPVASQLGCSRPLCVVSSLAAAPPTTTPASASPCHPLNTFSMFPCCPLCGLDAPSPPLHQNVCCSPSLRPQIESSGAQRGCMCVSLLLLSSNRAIWFLCPSWSGCSPSRSHIWCWIWQKEMFFKTSNSLHLSSISASRGDRKVPAMNTLGSGHTDIPPPTHHIHSDLQQHL